MATWEDPDELVVCPYDPVHRVQRKRLQYHLMKCRKNFNVRDYKQCPFNARHVVPKPEFEYHIQICEGRGRFEAEQLRAQTQRDPNLKGNTSIPAFDPTWCPETTESWDDDNVVYVPPTSGDVLISSNRPHSPPPPSPSPPPPPPQVKPRPLASAVDDLREPLQPRPPRLEGQATSQIFNQAMQSKPGAMTTVSVGRGRGRGRGRGVPPGFLPNAYGEVIVGKNMSGVAMVPASAVVEAPEILEERKAELVRRMRKLQKMLRQIERLESKTTPLLEDEIVKIGKKQQIFDQLQQLKEVLALEDE